MDQVISFSPTPSVIVWENRILPTPVLYITLVWGVLLLFTPQSQRRTMFLFLSGTGVIMGILVHNGQIATDFFMTTSSFSVTSLTERLPEGSLASLWYRTLMAQSILLMAVIYWLKQGNSLTSRALINNRIPHGLGLGLLMATVAYLYDPFATRLPRAVMEKGISLTALSWLHPDGSRVSISAPTSLSEPSSSGHLLSALSLAHSSRKKDDKETYRNKGTLQPTPQSAQGPPFIQPRDALNEVHANASNNIHHTDTPKAPVATQIWVLWRADSVDCMKFLEQIAQHQKRFPDAWRHTHLIVINEGDDTLTLTRSLSRLPPLVGKIVWDKQQHLLAALKLQVLPVTLLLDANALLKGNARVQDYRIGYMRF